MSKTTDFYGSQIKTGLLHKELGVKQGVKIPLSQINAQLQRLKAKKTKSAADVTRIRQLVFAKNAKTKFG